MTDKKQPGDHPSEAINSEKEADDEEAEFVERDPTGRYGRYNEILGKGAFKTVYRAFDEVDGIEVAWNQVKVEDVLQSPEDLERLYSEVHLLKSLKHKNIIKLYNSWVDTKTKNVNFITEIFTSGTLRQYRKKHKHVDIRAVKNWAKQILRGLLYLHSHNPPIIHRDLKCDNIFVNGNQGEVKIGDLGLAAILRQANAAHSVIGTPEFMAPELYEEEYNELVDIYSFGMCLLEMVTFEYPYSECNNAAQIYKKVTSGKKPAALEKVKDLEVRAFIEKCLATASRRLPARELLMDPFLQSEQTDMDLLPPLSRSTSRADDMEGLSTIKEEPSSMCRPPSVESNSRRTEASPTREREMKDEARCNEERLHSNDQSRTSSPEESQSDSDQGIIGNFQKGSSFREEGRGRSRDFRVKGKKKDDDTVFLRVRIADLEGHIRNIHFPFSIEGDTAMSVASEMVGELDLSDQDVTTIAEMIDAAIVALVPDWRPGAAFDDNGADEQAREESPMVLPQSPEEETHAAVEVISRDEMDTENNIMPIDILPVSTIKTRSPRTGPLSYSPRVEGSYMYGRFEEVTYHPEGSEFAYKFDTPHIFSSDSSEVREDGDDWDLSGEVISPVGTSQGTFCLDVKTEQTPTNLLKIVEHQNMDSDAPGCNEVLVTIKSSGCAIGEQAKEEDSIPEETSGTVAAVVLEGPSGAVTTVQSNSVHVDTSNSAEQDESIARELKLLAMRQEQELRELQRKHESALLEIRNRCRCKRSSSLNSPQILSPHDQNVDTLSHLLDSELGRAVDESGETLVAISDRNNLLQCKPDQGFCFFDQNNPNTSNTPQVGSPSSASASCSNECFTDLLEFQAAKPSETTVLRTAGIWPVSSMEESLSKENGGCSSSASYETLFDGSERFVDASCSERPDVASEFSGRETALSGNVKQQDEASTSGLFLSGEEKYNVLRTPPSPGNQSGQRIEVENTEQGEPGISDVAGKTFLSGDVASRTFLSGPARSLSGDVAGSTRGAADETRTVLLGQGSQEELLVRSLSADVGRGLSGKREESMGILRYNQQQEEQQRKEQLQKSIAELEAKTLEGLHYSKNGYLVSSKKMSGINQQQQQQQQP